MAIEFHCPHCGKLLKTADDKAGVRARCPDCQEVVTVPELAPAGGAAGPDQFEAAFGAVVGASDPSGAAGEVAQAAPEPADMKTCPMCGAQIRAAATRCRYCGEDLTGAVSAETGAPTQIEAGDILSRTWAIFQREMGMCVAVVVLVLVVNFLSALPDSFVRVLVLQRTIDPGVGAALRGICIVGSTLIDVYFSLGLCIVLLKIAKGDKAQFGDLFTGGPYFLRGVGAYILFMLMFAAGVLAFCVGALVVVLMFGPFMYALVDRDCRTIECLTIAKSITTNNLLSQFVLILSYIGLIILGAIPCFLGWLVTIPFMMLSTAVAYLAMSGLPTAERRPPA